MTVLKQPKYILFDVGNVLLYKVTHEDENIAKLLGISREEYRKFLDNIIEEQSPEEHSEFKNINTTEKEKLYLDKLHKKMCKKLGIVSDNTLINHMTKCRMKGDFALKDGVIETLNKLSSKYHLGIFSNALPSRRFHELKIGGLDEHFDHIFISHEIGLEKPDPKSFEYVLDNIGYSPKDVMFIDDKFECLEGAEKAGITNLIMIKINDDTGKYLTINNITELVDLLNNKSL